jgi:single-strand DNA-binding protein
MISLNRVTIIGNIGQDPEIRYLDNGVAVGRFSVATTESYKDADGNWQNKPTDWHNVVVWRNLAERAEKELKKGMSIYVEGQVNYRTYQDKDGNDRKVTDILCRAFRPFVDTRTGGGSSEARLPGAEHDPFANRSAAPQNNNSNNAAPTTNAPTTNTPSDNAPENKETNSGGDEMGDDLPF